MRIKALLLLAVFTTGSINAVSATPCQVPVPRLEQVEPEYVPCHSLVDERMTLVFPYVPINIYEGGMCKNLKFAGKIPINPDGSFPPMITWGSSTSMFYEVPKNWVCEPFRDPRPSEDPIELHGHIGMPVPQMMPTAYTAPLPQPAFGELFQ